MILEENVPQLDIVLLSILESRRLVMIVAIVVADGWQHWRSREILLNRVHHRGHRFEHYAPVRVRNRLIISREPVFIKVTRQQNCSDFYAFISGLVLCLL